MFQCIVVITTFIDLLVGRFMQLDLGHLEIHNSFEWHGGTKDIASAVHLDVLHAEVGSTKFE